MKAEKKSTPQTGSTGDLPTSGDKGTAKTTQGRVDSQKVSKPKGGKTR